MGTISKGILGPVSGTVGTVIGGTWKGISYLRSQPTSGRTVFTPKQLEQQARFKLMITLLRSMTPLLQFSFRSYAVRMSGFNNATRYNLMNAITGTYPALEIAYDLLLVSRGDLPNATNPSASSTTSGTVSFAWTDNSGMGKAEATDLSLLVAYCPSRNQCIYAIGAARSAEADTLAVEPFSGLVVHTYIGFISADERSIASSVYTGMLTVD